MKFNNVENQNAFLGLPKDQQTKAIEEAHIEANVHNETYDKLIHFLEFGNVSAAQDLLNDFPLQPEVIQKATQGSFRRLLEGGYFSDARALLKAFPLPAEMIQKATQISLCRWLCDGEVLEAQELLEAFPLPAELIQTEEVQKVVQANLHRLLEQGNVSSARALLEAFPLPAEVIQEAVHAALMVCLKRESIEIALQIINEFDLDLNPYREQIMSIMRDNNYPISLEAANRIMREDRFGANLIGKYPQFDRPAKEAVGLILSLDEAISPNIDRRSLAYRQAVLDSIRTYKRNPEIAAAISEAGMNLETWLNYNAIDYFTLGQADDLTTAEKIKTPIERLVHSFSAFTKALKETLGEYRKELFSVMVPEDTSELQKKLNVLLTNLSNLTDETKREGIERGIASLRVKLANPKQIPVWDKVMAEFSKLTALAESIAKTNQELEVLERHSVTITDDSSLKLARDRKEKIWAFRKKLTTELTLLKRRSDSIFDTLAATLKLAIGPARADGIKQEVQSAVAEHIDHLDTDLATIFSFVKNTEEEDIENVPDEEVVDDDEYKFNPVHAKQLESRPMSIRVAGRSRQDLYTGNYTTCCIRIDSDYHTAESPIADYLTDVGMQNVLIYDEVTGTPIACAWCWLGYHKDTNQPALVIDNVEGWQKYTVNFKSQLNERLRNYLDQYAQAIGATLTQGPDYNDLDPIPPSEQGEWYYKLGGSNRPDEGQICGYYLEAEYTAKKQ